MRQESTTELRLLFRFLPGLVPVGLSITVSGAGNEYCPRLTSLEGWGTTYIPYPHVVEMSGTAPESAPTPFVGLRHVETIRIPIWLQVQVPPLSKRGYEPRESTLPPTCDKMMCGGGFEPPYMISL